MVAAAYSQAGLGSAPRILRTSQGSCNIKHKELIANITDGATFAASLQNFSCNPGLAATFPWLSQEAAGWERYRFNSLRFYYLTRVSSATAGSVIMAPDYDASDASPVSEQILSSFQGSVEASLWKDLSCSLARGAMHADEKEKFVRVGVVPANSDIRLYDVANMIVSTTGGAVGLVGKFWVEYDVTLFTPQIPSGGFISSGAIVGATAQTTLAPLGTAAVASGGIVLSATGLLVSFSNAVIGSEYLVVFETVGTVVTVAWQYQSMTGGTLKTNLSVALVAGGLGSCTAISFIASASAGVITTVCTATTVTRASAYMATLAPAPSL
jgi:hypothetical protein